MSEIGPLVSLNSNLRGMGQSATVAINERSNDLLAAGRTVYKLGLGQSPFPVPTSLVAALREHAHQKDYLPVKGLLPLREAIADYHSRREDVHRRARDVLVAPGSKELMFLAQLAYDGVLMVPAPSWVSYEPQARLLGHRTQWLFTHRSDGWLLTPDALDSVCASEEIRPRLLILNYPGNPSGASYTADALRELAAVARKHRILILSDEIYGEVHHTGGHVSIARFYPEGTIISSGLSKWCGAGGWRLGHFSFPAELSWLCDAMAAAASETYTSTSAPIQHAAVSAFADSEELIAYLRDSRRILRALCKWTVARLGEVGADCGQPVGGFYVFPDVSALRERLARRDMQSAPSLCERLLEDTGVASLPGSAFGRPANELTLRLAYVDFDGEAALAAASVRTGELDEVFLRAHCGNVTTAIDAMCDWLGAD